MVIGSTEAGQLPAADIAGTSSTAVFPVALSRDRLHQHPFPLLRAGELHLLGQLLHTSCHSRSQGGSLHSHLHNT